MALDKTGETDIIEEEPADKRLALCLVNEICCELSAQHNRHLPEWRLLRFLTMIVTVNGPT